MPLMREMVLVGLSHRTASVELREKVSVAPAELKARLGALRGLEGIQECWLLSTCNRTEVLALAEDPRNTPELVKAALFAPALGAADGTVYVHQGIEAVFHVFRVASGLDSQVLGESQILAQMKDATTAAREAGTLGTVFASLLDQALALGKRVRTQTKVGEGTLSVAKAAVELAQKVFGDFRTVKALVIGAGETGLLVARHLVAGGCRDIVFANRTPERAEEAAQQFHGRASGLDELPALLSDMNLTVVSVDAPRPIVLPCHLNAARLRRHDRPPVLIDISVPRGVDPVIKQHKDLLVHDLDDLDGIVARHRVEREAEVDAAGRLLVEETHKWFALRTYAAFKPVITELVDRFEAIRGEVLAQLGGERAEPGALSEKLTRRLLDEALVRLKEGARATLSAEHLGRRYRNYLERS